MMDTKFPQRFENAVAEDQDSFSPRPRTLMLIEDSLRRGDLTAVEALPFINRLPAEGRYEAGLIVACLARLPLFTADPALCVALMNFPRLFHILDDGYRWKIRDHVTQDAELMRQVGVGWVGGNNVEDLESFAWLRDVAPLTHSLECIQEAGDESTKKADEYLYNRVSQGLGPEKNTSRKTAEFLAGCHALALEGMPILRRVQMASEMIIMLIGSQPRRSRQLGIDEVVRPAHQKLRTLAYLQDVITNAMTPQNAGVVLRWAMTRYRHHQWFWQRLMNHVRSCRWHVGKVQHVDGFGLGAVYHLGSRQFVVLPFENNSPFGEIKAGQTVMTPSHRFFGKPVHEGQGLTVYQGSLQPLLPPTQAMQDMVDSNSS